MNQGNGDAASGPGSHASHEAGEPSSPPVSIPIAAKWYAGDSEEFFRCGPHETRDAALEDGLGYFGEDSVIYLIHAAPMVWPTPDAGSIIDMMIDNADELFVEDGFDDLAGTKEEVAEAEKALNALLEGWMQRYGHIFPTPTTFGWIGGRETVLPAQGIEAASADETRSGSAEGESPVAEPCAQTTDKSALSTYRGGGR